MTIIELFGKLGLFLIIFSINFTIILIEISIIAENGIFFTVLLILF